MKNLELIRNKNGGYGIRDLDTGKVIIPGMYKKSQLESIIEIIPLSYFSKNYSSGIYVLKGLDIDNNEVYGLYNSNTNDFIDLIYEGISLVMKTNADSTTNNEIRLVKGDNRINYDLTNSQDNSSINQKFKMFTNDNKTYGLKTAKGKEIIPSKYSRREIFNIGDIVEVFEGVYILKDKDDSEKIVGFYDNTRGLLKKGIFTSYEIISNILVLKNRIESNENRSRITSDLLLSKTYISLYDPKNGKYIYGDYFDREISEYESDGYRYENYITKIYECLSETNGVILLSSNAFYDTVTGYLQENVYCYENDGKIEIFCNEKFIGYYDIEERKFKEYSPLSCEALKKSTHLELYLSSDKTAIRVGNKCCPIQEYSDFVKIYDGRLTFLLDRDYNFLSFDVANLEILEIKPETVEQLGIPTNCGKSVYLINGELYTFRKTYKLINIGEYKHFTKISSKVVGAVEYEYGVCSVEADSAAELDYKLDKIDKRERELSTIVEDLFYQDEALLEEYPKLVKRKN